MPSFTLPDRALIEVTGADAGAFLQGLLTQDVQAVDALHWRWAALLSPQGKLMFEFLITRERDGFLLDVEAARRAELMKRLNLYKLRAAVTLKPLDHPVVAGWDMAPIQASRQDARHPEMGWRGTGTADSDSMDYRRHRWSLGIAEGAAELGIDRLLWLEANAVELGGVSFAKGCYIGQENTARMHHRNKLRKRVFIFKCGTPGNVIQAGDRAAGDVLFQQDDCGVALMRLEYVAEALTLGGAPVNLHMPGWLELPQQID